MSRPCRHLNFDVGWSNLADTFSIVGIKKLRVFSFYSNVNVRYQKKLFLHLNILTVKIKENLIINYKILFASLFDIITKPPSLSILFFNPTLTPLLPHSPLQHSCHFNFPSHHYFHPHFSSTTFFTPFSLSQHSFHPILTQPLFSPHSPSTTLFTPLSLTLVFSHHSLSHHSFHPTLPLHSLIPLNSFFRHNL